MVPSRVPAAARTGLAPRAAARGGRGLWPALAAGALVRAIAACCAPGFYARDDYFHVVVPAQAWLADPSFDWAHSGMPGAGIRSELLPRLVWLLLRGLEALAVTRPEAQLRCLYLVMGAYGLGLVPAMAAAGRRALGAAAGRRAAWLAALFFVFPYASTRLLIEALAMVPLCAAVACLHGRRRRQLFVGGLCAALACWWRLQVASALPGLAVALWLQAGPGRRRCALAWAGAGLLAGFAAQAAFDVATGQAPLAPVVANVRVNLHPHAGLSRSTFWGYAGFWAVVCLGPVAPWLVTGALRAAAAAPLLALPWLTFVATHALVPHKEDRFMLPVVPLLVVLFAAVPEALASTGGQGAGAGRGGGSGRIGRIGRALARTWPRARPAAGALAAALLVLACTAASQANLRHLAAALRTDAGARAVVSLGPELQRFYLGGRGLPSRRHADPDAAALAAAQSHLAAAGTPANRFAAYAADAPRVEVMLRLRGLSCAPPRVFRGWWLDRLVFALNPRRNRRRGPLLLYACEGAALAAGGNSSGMAGSR